MSSIQDEMDDELRGEGVPPELFALAERLDTLRTVMYTFRGWDPDIAALKHSAISALASWKKSIKDTRNVIQQLLLNYKSYEDELKLAKQIKQKSQFILDHIPKQFNCPPILTLTRAENHSQAAAKNVINAACSNQVAVGAKEPAACKNVPEILFLTMDEFENIPKYLKGRVTYEKINSFIEVFNRVLSCKYAIFKKKKSALKKKDADLWNEFNKQELKETKGLFFCVADDFRTLHGTTLDKASLNMMTILRHCGRIREVRSGGIVRYVAMF